MKGRGRCRRGRTATVNATRETANDNKIESGLNDLVMTDRRETVIETETEKETENGKRTDTGSSFRQKMATTAAEAMTKAGSMWTFSGETRAENAIVMTKNGICETSRCGINETKATIVVFVSHQALLRNNSNRNLAGRRPVERARPTAETLVAAATLAAFLVRNYLSNLQ